MIFCWATVRPDGTLLYPVEVFLKDAGEEEIRDGYFFSIDAALKNVAATLGAGCSFHLFEISVPDIKANIVTLGGAPFIKWVWLGKFSLSVTGYLLRDVAAQNEVGGSDEDE